MAKQLTIHTTYDALTRQLISTATFTGFVPVPDGAPITALQTDTVTLFKLPIIMTADDQSTIMKSIARALLTGNIQLEQWAAAVITQDKADQLLASAIDPVETFNDTLDPIPPIPEGGTP